jgi:hypothetical protein
MRRSQSSGTYEAPRVVGAEPLKVKKPLTDAVVRKLREQLGQSGRCVAVKAIRFIPSSRTDTGTGSFQVVANAVVEVTAGSNSPPRAEAFDFVVTVGKSPGGIQRLDHLAIPTLQRAAA